MSETTTPQARKEPMIRISRYLATLKGTRDEIYSKLITLESRPKARTAKGWADFLVELKARPARAR